MHKIMRALSSPVRREILGLVWDRELAAGEISAAFDFAKPTISQHLAVLRDADLVTLTVAGTSRLYRARQQALRGLHGALDQPDKWVPADDLPERMLATARTQPVVVASVDVPTSPEATFAALTDPALFSSWLGVPVRIEDRRFSCTMEWGTRVRGVFDVVSPPSLLALRWDFEDDNVPVPGNEMTGYVRLSPHDAAQGGRSEAGTLVEVHQIVETDEHARFMEVAWSFVLGRLRAGVLDAVSGDGPVPPRAPRAKHRNSS
ncbi:MAG TPA: metalloregulator ArsR/SmtB family transcription factor [Acidimicrobiales bacterium]|nr:metalloregulator ArsR/SmtB family transcription factor [Acidimicrobiales bacterium]